MCLTRVLEFSCDRNGYVILNFRALACFRRRRRMCSHRRRRDAPPPISASYRVIELNVTIFVQKIAKIVLM